jgi:hypothetical protein
MRIAEKTIRIYMYSVKIPWQSARQYLCRTQFIFIGIVRAFKMQIKKAAEHRLFPGYSRVPGTDMIQQHKKMNFILY